VSRLSICKELDVLQKALKDKYGRDREALARSTELAALKDRFRELQQELQRYESDETRIIIERMKPDIAELARRHGVDVVIEVSNKGGEVVYRGNLDYPPPGPDLTDELIRLHNQRLQ
jgi:Skp family chaperone for outer membrane proteins